MTTTDFTMYRSEGRTFMSCGCEVERISAVLGKYRVTHCPVHSAAPELLEALEITLEAFENFTAIHSGDIVEGARTAIAKARGEQG
jgi:hypothetical protein